VIDRLVIVDPNNTVIPWWANIKAFQGKTEFTFKPGINVLWGRNGSGKSSLVKMLARLTHCEQGGVSKVTSESLREFRPIGGGPRTGQQLVSDGKGVWHCDPSVAVGLIGGAFDYDFMDMGVRNTMFKGSHGETTLMRVFEILKGMKERKVPTIEYKSGKPTKPGVKADRWQKENYENWLEATKYLREDSKESGPPTVLLDEPDRSMDIPTQLRFWDTLTAHAKNYQMIVATHSMFALDVPGANYIEVDFGYLNECRRARSIMMTYAAEAERAAEKKPEPTAPPAEPAPEPKKRTRAKKEAK
jgi:energy-coupling factor transporter ATP-binding protein EcfA2